MKTSLVTSKEETKCTCRVAVGCLECERLLQGIRCGPTNGAMNHEGSAHWSYTAIYSRQDIPNSYIPRCIGLSCTQYVTSDSSANNFHCAPPRLSNRPPQRNSIQHPWFRIIKIKHLPLNITKLSSQIGHFTFTTKSKSWTPVSRQRNDFFSCFHGRAKDFQDPCIY